MSCSKNVCMSNSSDSPISVDNPDVIQGCLSKHFQQAASLTVQKYVSKIKFSMFKQKYPEVYKNDPALLENVYMQLKSQLQVKIEEDLKNCYSEQFLFKKLQELDHLIKEANKTDDQISWRPSGDPNEDVRDHRCIEKLKHKMSLESFLNNYNAEIQQLENKAGENHEEILEIKREIHQINQQNNKMLEMLTTNNIPPMEEFHCIAEEKC